MAESQRPSQSGQNRVDATWLHGAFRPFHEPIIFGTICGLCSAVGYTAANACLRASASYDPVWVSSVKAFPTVALFGPPLLVRLLAGRERTPTWRQMIALIIAALICQLLGNVVFQWSLGVIGMALAVPLTLGAMIIGAAVMGRIFLHEPVTRLMAVSLVILVVAAFILSLGAGEASTAAARDRHTAATPSIVQTDTPSAESLPAKSSSISPLVFAGVGAACLSGLAYALLGVVIRSVVRDSLSVFMTMVIVTLTGVVALGAASLYSPGLGIILQTPKPAFAMMVLAGVFNAVAFLALTKSLQLIPVARVNALNATQAAMGALAGIVLFAEPSSWYLWLGVGLTAVGLLLMRRPVRWQRSREDVEVMGTRKSLDRTRPLVAGESGVPARAE